MMNRHRFVLTCVWFAGMFVSMAVVIGYLAAHDAKGVPLLVWADVVHILQTVLAVYAIYLGGIIAFWFTRPFKLKAGARDRIRFRVALLGTVVINIVYVAGLSIGYWDCGARIEDIVGARQVVAWLSFIVGPANVYYFGIRRQAEG